MPAGKPSAQTIASDKYQKKAGYMVKGFKLKRELVEEYEKACEKAGVNQTAQIRKLMQEFIDSQKNCKK